jgi:hypothetical protein
MTREFRERARCPHCGNPVSTEPAINRWIRENPRLDSREASITVNDIDLLVHAYRTPCANGRSRLVQCQMIVEIKRHGAFPSDVQRDSFSILSQYLRNRKATPTSRRRGRHAADLAPLATVSSLCYHREVQARSFGVHLLRLSGECPLSSEWMEWDGGPDLAGTGWKGKPITVDQLEGLLRFDLDPDTLRPMDLRRHHIDPHAGTQTLFDLGPDDDD